MTDKNYNNSSVDDTGVFVTSTPGNQSSGLTPELDNLSMAGSDSSNNSSCFERKKKRKRSIDEAFMRQFVTSILEDIPSFCTDLEGSQLFSKKWKKRLEDELSFFNRGFLISILFSI